jgi:hypothetical protein
MIYQKYPIEGMSGARDSLLTSEDIFLAAKKGDSPKQEKVSDPKKEIEH